MFLEGRRATLAAVRPEFLRTPRPHSIHDFFTIRIERLMRAIDTGEEDLGSGHGYRQALEIAIALKLSAQRNHRRISLPLEDRSLRLFPHPYRLLGGDVAGWKSRGYEGPPKAV